VIEPGESVGMDAWVQVTVFESFESVMVISGGQVTTDVLCLLKKLFQRVDVLSVHWSDLEQKAVMSCSALEHLLYGKCGH